MLRPLNQQTTDARRHPMNSDESADPPTFEPFGSRSFVSAWTVRGGNRDGPAGPPPPFMVVTKSAPREAHLERSPALRWLRREVGPEYRGKATSTGALPRCPGPKARTPSSRRKRDYGFRFQAETTSSSRLSPRDLEARFVAPVGAASRARGVEGSFAGILQPCSRGFLHSTTFMGTPLDRASPSTSPRAVPAGSRE